MKNKKTVLKLGDPEVANILWKAQEEAAKENGAKNAQTTSNGLPDLDKIDVTELALPTFEEKKEIIHQEAEEVKQWSEGAGKKLMQVRKNLENIRMEIEKIESDMIESDRSSEFSATARDLLVQWKQKEKEEMTKEAQLLSVKNEAAKGHMEFSALLNEIKNTDPTHFSKVRDILNRLVKLGRYRIATFQDTEEARKKEKWPYGTRFFERNIYIPTVPLEEKSAGQRALEAELKKLIDAAKTSKPGVIKTNGNADLTGYGPGKPGVYYFYSPERIDKKGQQHAEGYADVKLYDANKREGRPYIKVDIIMAAGDLGWTENHPGKRSIPLLWIQQGEIPEGTKKEMKPDQIKYAARVISTLRALYGIWKNEKRELNPETTELKKETKSPEQNSMINPMALDSISTAMA